MDSAHTNNHNHKIQLIHILCLLLPAVVTTNVKSESVRSERMNERINDLKELKKNDPRHKVYYFGIQR